MMDSLEKRLQQALQECELLKKENQQLKSLLIKHNIELVKNESIQHTPAISISKEQMISERIELFRNLFKGRTDVYAVRWESKNGRSGYSPACAHEWQPPICQKPNIKCSNCTFRHLIPLTNQVYYDHLIGKQTIGLYPLLQDQTCWFLAVDFDKNNWQQDVQAFIESCKELNVPASIERSRSGNGCHVWIFLQQATSAVLVRKLGHLLLSRTLSRRYELGMDSFDRLFPNQDTLPKGGFGNLIALPLQNGPRKKDNSVFIDENLIPYPDQWQYLKNVKKMSLEHIKQLVQSYYHNDNPQSLVKEEKLVENKVPNKIIITEKNGLSIAKTGLSSGFIQKLIQLTTFNNPAFFKAQANRLSTNKIPRIITCYEEADNSIILPRGCKQDLISLLNKSSIDFELNDCTNQGAKIDVNFYGQLSIEQDIAVNKLFENNNGILSATTGFGKTVVAAALIAKRHTNTLIIVHRKQLVDQWKERLMEFLHLDKNQIGEIGGGKNKPTGVIDIATIQSLNYKGEIKDLVTQYGTIIVDECHHISAYSFERVLKKATAKYIYGLTATPTRKDGLQPIMSMQLGAVRHKVSAKKQAELHAFEYLLIPKYTKFKSSTNGIINDIQDLYNELTHNEARNQLIFDDVLNALDEGASPLLLTERVEHAYHLASKFTGFVKNIIVLTGKLSRKEAKENLIKLENLPDSEERLIIATGKYIGEGFDHAKLDTLFLTCPISWKGTIQQYIGRLHRHHPLKTQVKVFDYIDQKEPMLQAMFEKRLKAYQSMGYTIIADKSRMQSKQKQLKLF